MDAGRRLGVAHFLEKEDERCRDQAEQAEDLEIMRVSHEQRLLAENSVKNLRRLMRRAPGTFVRGQPALNRGQLLLVDRIVLRKVTNERGLVRLRAGRQKW